MATAPPLISVAMTKPPTPAARPARRMTLESIGTGTRDGARRYVIYGPDGMGKTTAATSAPAPVVLGPEDGLDNFAHVQRFPKPRCWQDILDAVDSLIRDESAHRTLVVDTVDWVEPLLWRHVCEDAFGPSGAGKNIEDIGYGKGYQRAVDGWRVLLSLFERLRRERGMHVLLLAHTHIKTFRNPEGDDFDRYTLKIHDKAAALLREWAACVFFLNQETFAAKNKEARGASAKGYSTIERFVFTERTAAYDAKNRFRLPAKILLDPAQSAWDTIEAAVRAGENPSPTELRAELEKKLVHLAQHPDPSVVIRATAAIAAAGNDPSRLARISDHMDTVIRAAVGAVDESDTNTDTDNTDTDGGQRP